MGLIDEEVYILLNGKNVKYYENLGYKIPKINNGYGRITIPKGTKIKVKIKDIPKGSHIKVKVKCDKCNEIHLVEYRQYIKQYNKNNNIFCLKCSYENRTNNVSKKIKYEDSFKYWCLEHNKYDILNRWDYNLNNKNPEEIKYKTNNKYYFKCPRELHDSELKRISDFTNGHSGTMDCKQCNSFAQWGIDNICEDFIEKYWDYDKNTLNPWEINHSSNKKVWIKCQEKDYHKSYEVACNNFTCGKCRCPYCSGKKVNEKDSLNEYIINNLGEEFLYCVWSNKNNKSSLDYLPYSSKYVFWKCPNGIHKDFKRKISESTAYNFRCPICSQENNESILQEKVRLYLESLRYTILHETKCTIIPRNPKTNRLLPFDNEIKELKLIIEVNGSQHYKLTNFHNLSAKHFNTTPEYELHYQKVKDRYKRIIAKQNGYSYLEIPYWTDNKNEEWKQLIENAINNLIKQLNKH